MDYKVHGILQARILEWVAFPFFRGSSQPRDSTQVSCIAGGFFTIWAIEEESEKAGLKLNIQKTKITASHPITSWQIDGETMKTVTDFILGGSKITADGYCSCEIKRYFFFGRKAMTNLGSVIRKQRHCFADKGPSSQSYVFSSSHVWMWELD